MNILFLFVNYFLISSIVFVYCIGIERVLIFSNINFSLAYYVKNFITSIVSGLASFFIAKTLSSSLLIFIPSICIVITFCFNFCVSKLIRTNEVAKYEKNSLFGLTLFAVFEATSFLSLVLIILIGFVSLAFFHLVLYCTRSVIKERNASYHVKLGSLMLITIGFILLGVSVFDVLTFI